MLTGYPNHRSSDWQALHIHITSESFLCSEQGYPGYHNTILLQNANTLNSLSVNPNHM